MNRANEGWRQELVEQISLLDKQIIKNEKTEKTVRNIGLAVCLPLMPLALIVAPAIEKWANSSNRRDLHIRRAQLIAELRRLEART